MKRKMNSTPKTRSDDEAVQDAENNLWEELQNRDNR